MLSRASSTLVQRFFFFNMKFFRVSKKKKKKKKKKSCLFSAMKATTKLKQVLLCNTQTIKKTRRRNIVYSLTLASTCNSPRTESN